MKINILLLMVILLSPMMTQAEQELPDNYYTANGDNMCIEFTQNKHKSVNFHNMNEKRDINIDEVLTVKQFEEGTDSDTWINVYVEVGTPFRLLRTNNSEGIVYIMYNVPIVFMFDENTNCEVTVEYVAPFPFISVMFALVLITLPKWGDRVV